MSLYFAVTVGGWQLF